MRYLLSLPPNLVSSFHDVTGLSRQDYFCTCDPVGSRLGSGGGTMWLLEACHRDEAEDTPFAEWLGGEKRILIHAGGQSRRLPAYAPSGKILTPIPVFRWARGQRLGQNLLSLSRPLYEHIMELAPQGLNTLIASGDMLVRVDKLPPVPEADVVCYGMWESQQLMSRHGVFAMRRDTPDILDYMLQKPSVKQLQELSQTHFTLMDIGIWLLSDRAVEVLASHCQDGKPYDLYSDFGGMLGRKCSELTTAIVPISEGEFYHYGTSPELLSSTLSLQNLVTDQRAIHHLGVKPQHSIFTQNSVCGVTFNASNSNIWIENSHVPATWSLTHDNIVTGVPRNDWRVSLPAGFCVDVVPVGEHDWVLRPYDYHNAPTTQEEQLFPLCHSAEELGVQLEAFIKTGHATGGDLLSAEDLSQRANLQRLEAQRKAFRKENWAQLAVNHERSVFYQLDLKDAAREFKEMGVTLPQPLDEGAPLIKRISDAMLHAEVTDDQTFSDKAFGLLRDGLTASTLKNRQQPRLDVCHDQIVWSSAPARIDLAGGWTDTPPYCLLHGGNVVNIAIEMGGQLPLHTVIRPCKEPVIMLSSVDLGASEVVSTYEELADYAKVGSPFSIAKAALSLAGFLPQFSAKHYPTLRKQLEDFGCGIALSTISAIPAGSGLGTSSILASTVLAALADFCALGWDKAEVCHRTLVLEQLLTTGGGWQDQYGGVLPGVKLLTSSTGFNQQPQTRWMSDTLFTAPEYKPCHLLYYTGVTRTAKHILAEIVRGMFLQSATHLATLDAMHEHATALYEAILQGRFDALGQAVRRSWTLNQRLDSGTNPDQINRLTALIDDYCLGYKLPGAGGGGFLYMVAKDQEAAARIRKTLTEHPLQPSARFVDMNISREGLRVSRS